MTTETKKLNEIDWIFLQDVDTEVNKAREKFPGTKHTLPALMEEVGELSQAMIQFEYEDKSSIERIYKEAVQVAAMALRIATEGDSTLPSYKPPE